MKLQELKDEIKARPDLIQEEINALIDGAEWPMSNHSDKTFRAKSNQLIGHKEAYEEMATKLNSLEKMYSREGILQLLNSFRLASKDVKTEDWLDKKEDKL